MSLSKILYFSSNLIRADFGNKNFKYFTMSEKEEKLAKLIEKATSQITEAGEATVDAALVADIAGRFTMMLDNKDAMLVSGTDPSELETVRKNFVEKKLGVTDKEQGAAVVSKVADRMSGIKMKSRVAFYYLVQKELGK